MLTAQDLKQIENLFDKGFDRKLKPINTKLNKLTKFVQAMNRLFDSEVIYLRKRTDRIETHLHLPPMGNL